MYNCSFIVYDLETGGLINSKTGWIPPITEFACSVLDNKLDVIDEVDFFIKPYRPASEYQAAALNVSNITLERCEQEGLTKEEAAKKIIDIFKKAKSGAQSKKPILCGHNIDSFDNPILGRFLEENKQDISKFIEMDCTIDTKWWGRIAYPDLPGYTLSDCLMKENIDNEQAHRAIGDVRANKELIVKLLSKLRGTIVSTGVEESSFRKTFRFQMAKK